jgi:hypothetical protein
MGRSLSVVLYRSSFLRQKRPYAASSANETRARCALAAVCTFHLLLLILLPQLAALGLAKVPAHLESVDKVGARTARTTLRLRGDEHNFGISVAPSPPPRSACNLLSAVPWILDLRPRRLRLRVVQPFARPRRLPRLLRSCPARLEARSEHAAQQRARLQLCPWLETDPLP